MKENGENPTEIWHLAALKSYLKLGYVPLFYFSEGEDFCREINEQLNLPFSLENGAKVFQNQQVDQVVAVAGRVSKR